MTATPLNYDATERFDEAFGPDGLRPHWQSFLHSLEDLGPSEMLSRWRDAQHLIRENGVTYNVYGDPRGMARPWQLDPVPLLISAEEATEVRAGLIQRAKLFEQIARDLYGPQRLLRERLIPPELVYANPGFLRSCHGIELPNKRYLHLYACNLGRGANGRWTALGDRSQAPSGAGYALENRLVLSRALPEIFRDCQVHRLATFFRTLRDSLAAQAPRNRENPRIVLLTPGPYNETYFEHAYLARYLGYTLVEGGDLTVRDNRVYLKVLGGLQAVDVIVRRLDDDFCDPLELRPDSFLGVPGLVQAVRSGNVAVANALGTGALEATAFMAFLPKLCRTLLDEDLRMASAETWWCGDATARSHVLANLSKLVLKPAFPGSRLEPVFPDQLSKEALAVLVERIQARPWEYVGQERVPLATAPVLYDGTFVPRKLVLRTYVAADGDGYSVMPGGLTRVSAAGDGMVVSMQRGGGSKDTWVLSSGPVSTFSLLQAGAVPVELSRAGGDLPSRAADNLFWLGRYAERAEGITRLLRVIVLRLAERNDPSEMPEIAPLLRALALVCDAFPGTNRVSPKLAESEVVASAFDRSRHGSLAATLGTLLRVAGSVRDRISLDMWRALNGLADFPEYRPVRAGVTHDDDAMSLGDVLDTLNRAVMTLSAFGGLAVESMTRGESWRFLDMGRKLERGMHMVSLLQGAMAHPMPQEGPVLEAVLEVADSSMTYRRRYLGMLHPEAVIDLLLCDETNPRSICSQFVALLDNVDRLPRAGQRAGRGPEQRLVMTALSSVQLAEPMKLAVARDGLRSRLYDLLTTLAKGLPELSDTITQQYLSHLQTSRHLASSEDPTRGTRPRFRADL
jgi:uncharacterized circularly permuted ATP-grasp superfamily protein/uncharacterized alpha-E superfamily protein